MDREELLRSARNLYENPGTNEALKVVLEETYPELKESEDERIKRGLLRCLDDINDGWIALHGISKNDAIAYLEKQKEQKPAEWSEKDEPQKELAETYLAVFDKKFPILPTLKGKQLADYKNFLNKCQQILGLKYWGIRPLQAKLFEKLSLLWAAWGVEHLKGLGQTDGDTDNEKQEWSEEDKERVDSILSSIEYCKNEYPDKKEYRKDVDWLKSLRPQPQHKDTYYDIIHNILDMLKDKDFMQITPEHRVSLLNDIRVKCKNADECAAILDEPHWKPSEYTLSLVKKVSDGEMLTRMEQMAMETLYDDLKKL